MPASLSSQADKAPIEAINDKPLSEPAGNTLDSKDDGILPNLETSVDEGEQLPSNNEVDKLPNEIEVPSGEVDKLPNEVSDDLEQDNKEPEVISEGG